MTWITVTFPGTTETRAFEIRPHALKRMDQRGIRLEQVRRVLAMGRTVHDRGACIYVVGRQEVMEWQHREPAIRTCEGIHVVVCGCQIKTVYRNRRFRRPKTARQTRAAVMHRRSVRSSSMLSWPVHDAEIL